MHACIVSMPLKTKFLWLSVVALSLMLVRAESGSAESIASKVLDDAFLGCFVMYFFSECHFNPENTGTY